MNHTSLLCGKKETSISIKQEYFYFKDEDNIISSVQKGYQK
jgi:hypothetical protein